jgi:hypothetical protein
VQYLATLIGADKREEAQFAEYTAQANQAWLDRWPKHCRACSGGGGAFSDVSDYSKWTPCQALLAETCDRCGQDGLDPDSDQLPSPAGIVDGTVMPAWHAATAGWNFDDGVTVK